MLHSHDKQTGMSVESEPSHMFTQLYCERWLAEIRLMYIKMVLKHTEECK